MHVLTNADCSLAVIDQQLVGEPRIPPPSDVCGWLYMPAVFILLSEGHATFTVECQQSLLEVV